jgi:NAD(P)-dependent dehydrogenase (short-subunit alcohol dehydrogenase family)
MTTPNHAPYVPSKHAFIGLTRTLAIEFARHGVRVNAVCPGGTETRLLRQFKPTKGIDYNLLERTFLIEERCKPEDIARMICFIESDEARLVNGAMQSVGGGATA